MDVENSSKPKVPIVFRAFGWIFGSLSFLNLIRDATQLELYGVLREWSDAYNLFIRRVISILFGWIELGWIKIEDSESHVLVISVIIGAALGRAIVASDPEETASKAMIIGYQLAPPLVLLFVFTLFMLLIPAPVGALIGLTLEAAMIGIWAVQGDDKGGLRPHDFRRELLVVLAGFLLVVLANYMIFKPSA
jgi:hypothetical protein